MAVFKVRTKLAVVGGSVDLGADVDIYRSAANMLKTDDGFTVAGTPLVVPYATSSPVPDTNGDFSISHKGGTARLVFQSGGTAYVIALPSATNGTVRITVNSIP